MEVYLGNQATGRGLFKYICLILSHEGGEKLFVLDRSQKIKRNKIENAIIERLEEKNLYKEPFADMVTRYMSMWETCILLEEDIKMRGVQVDTEKGFKKNDSVALLTTTNKQMLSLLDKLGISVTQVKVDGGRDI
jgi:hypothetical protein